jgi:hypothetical protein
MTANDRSRRAITILVGLSVCVLIVVGLARPAAAAPHKILVLPADGTADAATRAKLTTQLAKLAKGLDGQVATAEATFADTALAVGCDPQAPGCSDAVIATLGVDELVWATATKDSGQVKVVVRRASKGAATREVSTTIVAGDSADRIDAGIAPLFTPASTTTEPAGKPAAPPSGKPAAPPPDAPVAPPTGPGEIVLEPIAASGPPGEYRDRNVGIAFATGGGVALVLGLALWASYSSLQDSIDSHPTNNHSDFHDLQSLEDRAATYAIAGDFLVLAGLAAGGLGTYYLYRSYNQHRIAVTPAPIGNGAGLTLTILGGL